MNKEVEDIQRRLEIFKTEEAMGGWILFNHVCSRMYTVQLCGLVISDAIDQHIMSLPLPCGVSGIPVKFASVKLCKNCGPRKIKEYLLTGKIGKGL